MNQSSQTIEKKVDELKSVFCIAQGDDAGRRIRTKICLGTIAGHLTAMTGNDEIGKTTQLKADSDTAGEIAEQEIAV